jgi:hypothetical protein
MAVSTYILCPEMFLILLCSCTLVMYCSAQNILSKYFWIFEPHMIAQNLSDLFIESYRRSHTNKYSSKLCSNIMCCKFKVSVKSVSQHKHWAN